MENAEALLALAAVLERACRLASGLEGIMQDCASRYSDVGSADYATWVLASELLCVLDEGRASIMLFNVGIADSNDPVAPAQPGRA